MCSSTCATPVVPLCSSMLPTLYQPSTRPRARAGRASRGCACRSATRARRRMQPAMRHGMKRDQRTGERQREARERSTRAQMLVIGKRREGIECNCNQSGSVARKPAGPPFRSLYRMFGFLKPKPRRRRPPPGRRTSGRQAGFSRLKDGLAKTRRQSADVSPACSAPAASSTRSFYEELETVLLTSDVGVRARPCHREPARAGRREGYTEAVELREALGDLLLELLRPDRAAARRSAAASLSSSCSPASTARARRLPSASSPTTAGEQGEGLLAAGDTFRAAAREQLAVWGERGQGRGDLAAGGRCGSGDIRCRYRRRSPAGATS